LSGRATVPKEPALLRAALEDERRAIVEAPFGAWHQVATGYERSWGPYTREQFYALGPHYPRPIL
jgi:hypothetical protein